MLFLICIFVIAPGVVENIFEKRLFFVVKKERPTEATFLTNKKRSLKKFWNGTRDWLLKKIRK